MSSWGIRYSNIVSPFIRGRTVSLVLVRLASSKSRERGWVFKLPKFIRKFKFGTFIRKTVGKVTGTSDLLESVNSSLKSAKASGKSPAQTVPAIVQEFADQQRKQKVMLYVLGGAAILFLGIAVFRGRGR